MNQSSTLFLKAFVWLFGLGVLALCIFVLPQGIRTDRVGGYSFILLGMYLTVVPFYIALYQALRLLHLIDITKAFSQPSVQALHVIKICALIIGGLYAMGIPYIYTVAEQDDAPGVVAVGLVLTCAPLVIAALAALLQKLLQNAIAIKHENDLTV